MPSLDAPALASPESDGIRERHSRPAGARRRRRDAAAGRCVERRLRQHRRRAGRVAVADPGLRVGGHEDQPARGRRSHADADADHLSPRRAASCRTSTSKACRSARAAACWCSTRFRSTRSTSSASGRDRVLAARAAAAVDVTLDGEQLDAGERPRSFRITVTAGPHTIGAALVDRARAAGVDEAYSDFRVNSAFTPAGGIQTVVITGPFKATSAGDTPSRRRIFDVQSGHRRPRKPVREKDRLDARAPRLSPAGAARRSRDADEVLSAGPRRRATSKSASSRRWRASSCRRRFSSAWRPSREACRPARHIA